MLARLCVTYTNEFPTTPRSLAHSFQASPSRRRPFCPSWYQKQPVSLVNVSQPADSWLGFLKPRNSGTPVMDGIYDE